MDSEMYQREATDGIVVSSTFLSSNTVVVHAANRQDAEWIYAYVDKISNERDLEQTDEMGRGKKYYLDDENDVKPVYTVTFAPTEVSQQRMLNWTNDGTTLDAPRDFQMTPLIAEMVYRTGAHEFQGHEHPYIEFEALGSQRLQAELQNLDIHTTNVDDLWHMDEDNSAKFREYAGIEAPHGGD